MQPTAGMAIAALVVGLVSLPGACFYGIPGVILGSTAIFLGLRSRGLIKRSSGAIGGGGLATAGWITGLCAVVLGTLWALYLFMLFQAMSSTVTVTPGPPRLP